MKLPDITRAEYRKRLERAQARMSRAGIDVLLLTTEPEIRWFTGFHTRFWQSPTRPWFLIVPRRDDPVAVIPTIGAAAMARTWMEDIRTWPSPRPADDGILLVVQTIRELTGKGDVIGLPMGHESHVRLPLEALDGLRRRLADRSWMDASPVVRALRQVKSEAEIVRIQAACTVACDAFDRLPGLVGAGTPEREVFRAFKKAALEAGADDVDYLVGGAAPGGPGDIISPPSDRPLSPGDVLILDVGLTVDGYFCDFDRVFSIGPPDAHVRHVHETLWQATEAGIRTARPGQTCEALFEAMNAVVAPVSVAGNAPGDGDVGRFGHGLGLQLTETPSIMRGETTPLAPGMVMTLEPSVEHAPGTMMVHEENVVIRADGPELLTRRAPREMVVL